MSSINDRSLGMLRTDCRFSSSKGSAFGAIYMDAQGFYAGVRKGIQDGAKDAGRTLEVIETNAQGDVSKESSFIDSLISAGV